MTRHTQDEQYSHCPDREIVPTELVFGMEWDGEAVRNLIRSKSGNGETPAFLLLGMTEAGLLRDHLAKAFGDDAVTTLNGTHYMGLEVVEVRCGSFVAAVGRKTSRTLQDPMARRPEWKNRGTDALWQLRM